MTIQEATTMAATRFIQTYTGGDNTLQILYKYAKEELQLPHENAAEFSTSAERGFSVKELQTFLDYTRLFTWYFINYVAITPATLYN